MTKKIEFSHVITDSFLSLSLPFSDGTYDHKQDILCFTPTAFNGRRPFCLLQE
uniref:transcriptional regulator FilR1 domain-containing protein n=1 Tax=Methanosarcina horonobensis TaxID=418008 RepID=UPI0022B8BC9D|nr:transcriptional regulator FilR1 domain-containing protein [Methanosarcina horonobensis]